MGDITTISWFTFLISTLVLLFLWWLSTKTRIGRKVIIQETPWNESQWTRFLLVILITLFILVNPIFHLLTFGIFFALYYTFVSRNFLSRNFRKIGSGEKISANLPFIGTTEDKVVLGCKYTKSDSILESKKAMDKCLFSFPMIDSQNTPIIKYNEEEIELELYATPNSYLASFINYIKKSGFTVQNKNKK
jgi:hypothetical protein